MDIKPTFCFLDESGNLAPKSPQRYFAVGGVVDSFPDELIKELHLCFEGLCSVLKKDPTRLEFKFASIKKSSLPLYLKIVDILKKYKSWRFCCLIVDKDDSNFWQPTTAQQIWENYLRFTKLLLKNNLKGNERTVLVADFYKQPKGKVHSLATLPQVAPQLVDTLQVESQGVLPVQVADILLGCCLYEGRDKVKLRLRKKVSELKQEVPQYRFNEWRIKWQ